MADEKITIQIDFDAQTGQVRTALNEVEKQAIRQGGRAAEGFGRGFTSKIRSSLATIGPAAIAAAGALAAAFGAREVIAAAARQEDAVNNLNASLRRIGEFSQSASQDLQDFASNLQSVTRFGDEAVLEQLAFAQGLGATAEQSKAVVAAAADLSAALNIDLNSATRNVARTLGGFAGELGEVIPELRNLTREQLLAGAAIDLIADKFQGIAGAQIRTFSGALQQASNSFGDLLENVGSFVTSSPAVIGLLNGLTQVFARVGQSISGIAGQGDAFAPLIQSGLIVAETYAGPVAGAFIVAGRGFSVFFDAVSTGLDALQAVVGEFAGVVGQVASVFAPDSELATNLQEFRDFTREELTTSTNELNASLKGLGEPIDTTGVTESIALIRESVAAAQEQANQAPIIPGLGGTEQAQTPGGAVAAGGSSVQAAGSNAAETEGGPSETLKAFGVQLDFVSKKAGEFQTNTTKVFKSVQNAAVQGIGRGVGSAFESFGRSLATGEASLADFGKTLLATFGQALSQLGQGFILQGIAQSIAGFGSGAPLIAAGIALTVFGGALSGLGGGAGPATAGGGVGNAAFTPADPVTDNTLIAQQEREEPQTTVAVNIQGDVLDSEQSGLKIVEILNNAFNTDGVTVVNGNFA